MVDVRELERRWIRYKTKKIVPYTILGIAILSIVLVLFQIDFTKSDLNKNIKKNTQAPTKNKVQETVKPITTPQPTVLRQPEKKEHPLELPQQQNIVKSRATERKKVPQPTLQRQERTIEPSMDFLRKMKDNSVLPQTTQYPPIQSTRHQQKEPISSFEPSIQSAKQEKTHDRQPQKKAVQIKINKISKSELHNIIKRFKKNNNPRLGVFIAKQYYNMGEYEKSYNYALLTNQIDSTIEESWIIFAKSLVKLGRKKQAIETLNAYIKVSTSSKAQLLLNNIKTGKFK